MKKGNTRKDFNKFSKRNTHKRRSKEAAINELKRAVAETNAGFTTAKFKLTSDEGRRGRVSAKAHHDEITLRGVFSSSKSGFGFVTPEDAAPTDKDIFIPEGKCGAAIDGDLVEIVYHTFRNFYGEEKTEGRVRKIIEQGRKTLIGVAVRANYSRRSGFFGGFYLQPDDARVVIRPRIPYSSGIKEGDKLEVSLHRIGNDIECSVLRNFGDSETKGANYAAILAEVGIEEDFEASVLEEAAEAAAVPLSCDGRVDRTKEIIFTIDGEDAKDLDDAVSLRRLPGGLWRLGVHIADVSYYVKEKTALDRAVMARGTSVYFVDKVVPMLPVALSNGACSLGADEQKYALSAIIDLSPEGEILDTKLTPSVIRSAVRGVYSEVNRIFDGTADKAVKEKYKRVIPTLDKMYELYRVLLRRSEKRGAMELESTECRFLLDSEGEPIDIIPRERGDAERLIEQFMLIANEAVATLLNKMEIPCVYRVHDEPPREKLDDFITFAHNLGFNTDVISGDKTSAADFSRLLAAAEEKGLSAPISYAVLRTMAKAEYSDKLGGHFGLGLEKYCHFTSPIRRLSDLATHRIIRKVLFEGKRKEAYASYARRAAAASSECEIRALNAERRIENLYKVLLMSSHVGEFFDAVVSSVASFGIFCQLDNTCEGLIPISDLPGVFIFDEKNFTMRSRDTVYRLADKLRVRLEEADITKGKLRFSVV